MLVVETGEDEVDKDLNDQNQDDEDWEDDDILTSAGKKWTNTW
jgi:hypothetical protein